MSRSSYFFVAIISPSESSPVFFFFRCFFFMNIWSQKSASLLLRRVSHDPPDLILCISLQPYQAKDRKSMEILFELYCWLQIETITDVH